MIAEVFNEESKKNYWWGYWGPGSGFYYSYCDDWASSSFVSSRLKFASESLFWEATKKFPKVYQTLMEK